MAAEDPKSTTNYFLTWRYLVFWVSSLLSNIGSWMQDVAQPWLVLSLSGSAFWVGATSFATNIPGLLFTLPGGILADRFDRKKVTLFFQAIQFIFVILLVVLLIVGWLKVWMIVVISFIVGLTDSLCNPSLQTIVPSLVKREDVPRAVSLSSTQFNLSRILGPVIAGIVIARFGTVACYGANAISYLPFFIAIWFIYPSKKIRISAVPMASRPMDQFREIKELLRTRAVYLPLATVFVANLFCGPLITFCSVLIRDVFHSGERNFGWVMASFGGGALMGAAVSFISLPASFGRNKLAAVVAILQGLLLAGIAFNRSFPLLFVLLVLAGAMQIIVNISVNTFLQEQAADNMRGRVVSLYQMAMYSGISIGALLTGFMVARLSITEAFLVNAGLVFVLQVWCFWRLNHKATPAT